MIASSPAVTHHRDAAFLPRHGGWALSLGSSNRFREVSPQHCDGAQSQSDAALDGGLNLQTYLAANYARLQRRLMCHLGCSDLAGECLHDTWLRLGDVEVRAAVQNPEAYVYRMACNVAIDRLRNQRPWQYGRGVESELESLEDHSPGPDIVAEARSDLEAFERAMMSLPRRHRSVLIGLRIEEKTRQEIADWLRISLRSVDTALRQALEHCAQASGRTVMVVGISSPRRSSSGA